MKHYSGRICFVLAIMALSFASVVPANLVSAHPGHDHGTEVAEAKDKTRPSEEARQKAITDAKRKISEIKTQSKQRLDETKRKVCEKHQATIQKQMTRMVEQRQKQIDHIAKIADQVQEFYKKQGKSVANYDTLVADIATKKAAAQAALDTTKPSATFSCSSDGPKAQLQLFKDQRAVVLESIKQYRQSVKALITTVKQAQPSKERRS